jgi:hypothetical protein
MMDATTRKHLANFFQIASMPRCCSALSVVEMVQRPFNHSTNPSFPPSGNSSAAFASNTYCPLSYASLQIGVSVAVSLR